MTGRAASVLVVVTLGGCAGLIGIEEESGLQLSGIEISVGTLEPAFSPDIASYRVTLPYPTDTIAIAAMTADPTVTLTIGGAQVTSAAPTSFAAAVGSTSIEIEALTTSGVARTYTVDVERADLDLAFGPPSYVFGIGMMYDLDVADLDANGTADLVYRTFDGRIGTIMNDGAGTYSSGDYFQLTNTQDIAIADIDGDGHVELLISSTDFMIARGNLDGTHQMPVVRGPSQSGAIAAGNLDGDGRADAVVANGAGYVTPLFGDGAMMMMGPNWAISPTSAEPRILRCAQLDGVGNDAVVALNTSERTISVGSYAQPMMVTMGWLPVSAGAHPTELVVADFDGDHHDDLAWLDPLAGEIVVATGYPAWATTTVSIGRFARSLGAGDLDGDGMVDLAALDNEVLIVARNGGGHQFDVRRFPAISNSPSNLAVGDFNHDGRADIVLSNATSELTMRLGAPR